MNLETLERIWLGPPIGTIGTTLETFAIDGTTDRLAFYFQAPVAGAVTDLWNRISSTTGTPPTYRWNLKDVDSTATPGSTTHDTGTFAPTTGAQDLNISLSSPYNAALGEEITIEYEYESGTISGSARAIWAYRHRQFVTQNLNPFAMQDASSGAYTKDNSYGPVFAVKIGGKWYGQPVWEVSSGILATASTDGHRRGSRFSLPPQYATATIVGIEFCGLNTISTGSSVKCFLSSASSGDLVTRTFNTDQFRGRSGLAIFGSAVTLAAGETYYAGLERDGTNVSVPYLAVSDPDHRDCFPGGRNCCHVEYDGSTWTENNTRVVPMALLCSAVTLAGGGSGRRPRARYLGAS